MKVILLAAGRGSRLGEKTSHQPKCMCVLAGKTLLDRCLESLEQAGIQKSDIGIVTGYCSEAFDGKGVSLFHNSRWSETNMFYSLTMARNWLEQEDCIVCYTDIVFSPHAARALAECTWPLSITYYTGFWKLWERRMENPLDDIESFKLNSDGQLTEIGQKPKDKGEIQGQYMGMIRFTPDSWRWVQSTLQAPLPKTVEKLDMTTLLNGMLKQGYTIHAIPVDELWLECDTQKDIEVYERDFANQLSEGPL